jgi:hypothetical protein
MKKSGVFRTIALLIVIFAVIVFFSPRNNKIYDTLKVEQVDVKTSNAKQVVKPDDIIEEVINGVDDQPVVNQESMANGPGMTNIEDTFVKK